MRCTAHSRDVRPAFLECTACSKTYEPRRINTCGCGGPLFARYEWATLTRDALRPRSDLWRYAPLLPLAESDIRSRGEGGTPLYRLTRIGAGGRVARLKVAALYVKDEGRNPTGTFKARGMAVAVPMACSMDIRDLVIPTAGNAGAALAAYAAVYGAQATVLLAGEGSENAAREAIAYGSRLLRVEGDIAQAGRIARELADATGAFNMATLHEPYRVEGKKTMLLEIWEALDGFPEWIVFPTGGGTGIAGMWKALHELRELGWQEGPWPRFAVVQAEGCAPLVTAWRQGAESAVPWPNPQTDAAGLRVPVTIADRIVLQAIRETRGAAVAVSDAAMRVSAQNLAVFEGISACLEGAATLAGMRALYDAGTITAEDRVVLVNTGRGGDAGAAAAPLIRDAEEAQAHLAFGP